MYRSELGIGKSGIASYRSEDVKPRTLISWYFKQNPPINQQKNDSEEEEGKSAGGIYIIQAPEDREKSAGEGRLGRATEVEGEQDGSSHRSNGRRRGEE